MAIATDQVRYVEDFLADMGITVAKVDERSFPDERWLIVYVSEDALMAAQGTAGALEAGMNGQPGSGDAAWVVTFRPSRDEVPIENVTGKGRLADRRVNQLIQLLEARSRTSDALPSLKYVEDPRASLAAVGASRHHLIYGRRGVGKTALLLEAKRLAERQGHVAVWMNAHIVRRMSAAEAFSVIAESALATLARHGGTSSGPSFARLQEEADALAGLRKTGGISEAAVGQRLADLNQALRAVLREGLIRLYLYIDDFYLLPAPHNRCCWITLPGFFETVMAGSRSQVLND